MIELLTEIIVTALVPNILVGRKKAAHGCRRWYTKWNGQYCAAGLAFLIYRSWALFTHFLLFPAIAEVVHRFYEIIGEEHSGVAFIAFFIVVLWVFHKER